MAFVSGTNATNGGNLTSNTQFTVAVTKSVTAGNSLGVLVNIENQNGITSTAGQLVSVADNAAGGTNTYVQPTGNFANDGSGTSHGHGTWLLYVQSLKTTASLTVTATLTSGGSNGSDFSSIVLVEYSGLGTFDVIGAMNSQFGIASGTTVTSGSATVTAGDTVIGITINWSGAGTMSAGSGFTQDYSVSGIYMSESLSGAAGGSMAATFGHSATDGFITGMLAFNAAGATPNYTFFPGRRRRILMPAKKFFVKTG